MREELSLAKTYQRSQRKCQRNNSAFAPPTPGTPFSWRTLRSCWNGLDKLHDSGEFFVLEKG